MPPKRSIGLCSILSLVCVLHTGTGRAAVEMEADPIAYIEQGYSLHTALTLGSDERVQLGLFALDVPGFVLDNRAFSVRYIHGVTLKFDRYVGGGLEGFFY